MPELTEAQKTARAAYDDEIDTLAEGVREEIDADPDCDRDRLLHEVVDASQAVTHHPHLTLAASRNAPRPEDHPDLDAEGLAYRAVKRDLRETLGDDL